MGSVTAVSRFRHAFTLTESLVAIVILALLVSLLFPAMSRYRAVAENGTCISHLRKLGSAIHLYTADHDGYLPPSVQEKLGTFEEFLEPYVGPWVDRTRLIAADTFYCPTNVRLGSPPKEGYWINENGIRRYKGWSGYMVGYTINASVHAMIRPTEPDKPRVRLSEVRTPSKTFSLADINTRGEDGRIPPKEFNGRTYFDPAKTQSSWFGGVHDGWCNFLFVDGHVDRFKLPQPLPISSMPSQETPWFP